jgi:hypothetical protein
MAKVGELIRGPQDGAKVKIGSERWPPRIYVGPKWLGDGFAAWSTDKCERFPVCYGYDGRTSYRHDPRG